MLKKSFGVLLAVMVLSFPGLAFSETVMFRYSPPEAGTVILESNNLSMNQNITIKVNGEVVQSMSIENLKLDIVRKTILEVRDGAPAKVKVHYITSNEEQNSSPGEKQKVVQPIEGKTYVIEMTDEGITVVDENGQTPNENETALVRREFNYIGKIDPMSKFLDGKQFSVGQTVDIPGEVARSIFDDPKDEIKTFSLSLRELTEINGENCGRFDVVLELRGAPEQGMKLSMDLKGEALLGVATTWPLMMDLKGEVRMEAEEPEQDMEIFGSGPVAVTMKMDYSHRGDN